MLARLKGELCSPCGGVCGEDCPDAAAASCSVVTSSSAAASSSLCESCPGWDRSPALDSSPSCAAWLYSGGLLLLGVVLVAASVLGRWEAGEADGE